MEIGKDEKWILEQARKTRQPIPERFLTAPELFEGLELFHMAFMDMSSCRQMSHGAMGPISWLTVQTYCNEYGIQGEQREDMFYFMQKMDEQYLEWSMERARQQMKQHESAK